MPDTPLPISTVLLGFSYVSTKGVQVLLACGRRRRRVEGVRHQEKREKESVGYCHKEAE